MVTSLTITSLSSMISAVKRYWGNFIEILPFSKVTAVYRSQGWKVTRGKHPIGSKINFSSRPNIFFCFELTLNLEPIIVASSHSCPMVNLLDQVQFGIVCVQVKLFPSWSTSVTTLWSVLALRSPESKQNSKYRCLTSLD